MIPDLFHAPVAPPLPAAEVEPDGDGSAFAELLALAGAAPPAAALPDELPSPSVQVRSPPHPAPPRHAPPRAAAAPVAPAPPADAAPPEPLPAALAPPAPEPVPRIVPGLVAEPARPAAPPAAVRSPVHQRREPAPVPRIVPGLVAGLARAAAPPPPARRPALTGAAVQPGAAGPIEPPALPPTATGAARPAAARKARPAPALAGSVAELAPPTPGPADTGPAAPPPRPGAAVVAPDVERVVRVVEEQARLAPPRSVVVDLDGDHGRIAVTLRGTEVHLAWDGANAGLPEVRAFQRAVVAALTGRGFDVAGDGPSGRSHREPRAPRRSPPPDPRRRHHDTGLML